jgi:hypothetical protein
MTQERLKKRLAKLQMRTVKLHNEVNDKFDGRYRVCISGLGEIELCDISKIRILAKGEKEVQIAMENLLKGAN